MKEKYIKTNILCFECKKDFGVDCAGRKQNESTRCEKCLKKYIKQLNKEEIEHTKKYFQKELTEYCSSFLSDYSILVDYKLRKFQFTIIANLDKIKQEKIINWFDCLPSSIKYVVFYK